MALKKEKDEIDLDFVVNKGEWIYGDLKADQINHDIPGNSFSSLKTVIEDNKGVVYYVCCLYEAEKDSKKDYVVTRYRNELRDDPYKTENELKKGYGAKMKYSVELRKLYILKIDSLTYELLKQDPFKQGKNSNGKNREPKLKIKKSMIDALAIYLETIE